MSALHLEQREIARGRHAELLSRADGLRLMLHKNRDVVAAAILADLIAVIARQEIELRQAIADKCARPVAERL